MLKFYRVLCGALCGLTLFCSYGANAYAADSCLDEVLYQPTTVYANSENLDFELTLKEADDFGEIPKEFLNEEKVLKKDFSYTLTSAQLNILKEKSHKVNNVHGLKVWAKNGQEYRLPIEKTFKLESPPENYVAIIPAGKRLTKKGDTTKEKYSLAEGLTVTVKPPKGFEVPLKLDAQTKVQRIAEPGTSSMGTTLTVEPKKAPLGGDIKLTVKKGEFDFGKARFSVCLRLHGKDEASKKPFVASDDVELQKAVTGEAALRARIPEKIDGLDGWYFAKPVDLLVVARIPGEVQGKPVDPQRAEVMTQEFSVSSRGMAVGAWILAFVIPWFVAALIRFKWDGVEAAQTKLTAAENKLKEAEKARDTAKSKADELTPDVEKNREALKNARDAAQAAQINLTMAENNLSEATKAQDTAKIAEFAIEVEKKKEDLKKAKDAVEAAQTNLTAAENKLKEAEKARDTAKSKVDELTPDVEKNRETLENARARAEHRFKAYVAELNPIWMVSGKVGEASLSLAQILLWSILVFSASFFVLVVSGNLLDLTNDVLILLGIAGGASVIAKITAATKDEKGQALAGAELKEPKWLDLIQTEGRPDIYKFQLALFTVLAAFFVTGKIYGTLEFPVLPDGLLTLIGISNGVYLTAKATTKTGIEKLAEKDEELKKAEADLKKAQEDKGKRKEEADKATPEKKVEANNALAAAEKLEKEYQTKVDNLKAEIEILKKDVSKKP